MNQFKDTMILHLSHDAMVDAVQEYLDRRLATGVGLRVTGITSIGMPTKFIVEANGTPGT